MKYFFLKFAEAIARVCPRRMGYGIARRFADVICIVDRPGRKGVMANLRTIHGHGQMMLSDRALHALARETFLNFAKYLVDFFHFLHVESDKIRQLIHFNKSREILDGVLAKGKGVIIISAHMGNWELGAAALTALGYKIHAIALWHPDPKLNDLYQRQRVARGIQVIPMGRAGRECIRVLRRNEIVALIGDRDYTSSRETVEFFGKPARLPEGPAKLSLATGAPILPVFMVRMPDDTYSYVVDQPIWPDPNTDTVETTMKKIAEALERVIRSHSEQWFLFHDLWNVERDRELATAMAFGPPDKEEKKTTD
jgi:KDO2-lipid IV(A) lauroyltransferase